MSALPFPEPVMRQLVHRAQMFRSDWVQDIPTVINTRDMDADGLPAWHPAFREWLTQDESRRPRNPEQRLRTTKVMRLLRNMAPRTYEVLYRVLVLGERIPDTTDWLNARAIRNDKPERYREKDTIAILLAGVTLAWELW